MNTGGVAAGIILLIIIVAIVAMALSYKSAAIAHGGILTIQLTDPPEVPNGTQALVISYASLSAHYIAKNGTAAWVSAQGSGSVDLLSVVNVSQVLGRASIPLNATVDMVRFNITSATITINNAAYSVTVPSQQLTVHVTNANKINGNESALVDLTPVVATIYTSNSTVFVLVPSVRAVVIGSSSANASAQVGAKIGINATERHALELSRSNISISGASLRQSGNTTSLSVTVVNNANTSVNIKHIMLFGNDTVYISYNGMAAGIVGNKIQIRNGIQANIAKDAIGIGGYGNSDFGLSRQNRSNIMANFSTKLGMNATIANVIIGSLSNGEQENLSSFNFSNMHNFNMSISEYSDIMEHSHISNATLARIFNITLQQRARIGIGINASHFRVLNFFVAQNGTLVLPFLQGSDMSEYEGEGYTMPAHSSQTFTFSGTIGFANGNMRISIIPGSAYNVVVVGEEGARSSMNITAG